MFDFTISIWLGKPWRAHAFFSQHISVCAPYALREEKETLCLLIIETSIFTHTQKHFIGETCVCAFVYFCVILWREEGGGGCGLGLVGRRGRKISSPPSAGRLTCLPHCPALFKSHLKDHRQDSGLTSPPLPQHEGSLVWLEGWGLAHVSSAAVCSYQSAHNNVA